MLVVILRDKPLNFKEESPSVGNVEFREVPLTALTGSQCSLCSRLSINYFFNSATSRGDKLY